MAELVCSICGLPKNLCVCGEISKEQQKIKIKTVQAKFKKSVTIVEGINEKAKAKELEKLLKRKLACGGTLKGTTIELQGSHKEKVREILLKEGYREDLIEI